ncbi:MAG TPA: IspD/TarI family cytidylyltransferase [Phycisphaerales bacterium]|nr:IspD/TarI family cytidylyltransferase [Phycisphaerales bacterium]
MADMTLAVILPAAGFSGRYLQHGGLRSKLDEDLGGKPLLQRTIETFTKFEDDAVTIAAIIVAGPHADGAFNEFKQRHSDRLGLLGATIVRGGVTHRWETVAAALAHVPQDCTHIAVHDAARPCMSHELLARVVRAAQHHPAVIPAVPASDTVKRAYDTGEVMGGTDPLAAILGESAGAKQPLRAVKETLDRSNLVLVQTPQVFRADLLRRAYATIDGATSQPTDDSSLVESLGERVIVVEGDPRNIKVTVPADLVLARAVMGYKEPEGRAAHKKF